MSLTTTFDDSRLADLSTQVPQTPWGRRTASFRTTVVLAVLIVPFVLLHDLRHGLVQVLLHQLLDA